MIVIVDIVILANIEKIRALYNVRFKKKWLHVT